MNVVHSFYGRFLNFISFVLDLTFLRVQVQTILLFKNGQLQTFVKINFLENINWGYFLSELNFKCSKWSMYKNFRDTLRLYLNMKFCFRFRGSNSMSKNHFKKTEKGWSFRSFRSAPLSIPLLIFRKKFKRENSHGPLSATQSCIG